MRKKVIVTKNSQIEVTKTDVKKKLNCGALFDKKQHALYKQFSTNKNYCIELIKYTNDKNYIMEKVNVNFTLHDALYLEKITLQKAEQAYGIFTKAYADCIDFSAQNLPAGQYYLHRDMRLQNFVFDKNLDLKLLDIDSFEICDTPLCDRYISTLHEFTYLIKNFKNKG